MSYSACIIADSVGPAGVRILTLSLRYPRFILAEFNTHRMFSRNSASSRAVPVSKMIASVIDDPVEPAEWGCNRKGMQAGPELGEEYIAEGKANWREARRNAIKSAEKLMKVGAHKQIINRVLEPFAHTDTVATGTYSTWCGFLTLRLHKDAQPEIRRLAVEIREAVYRSAPKEIGAGEWHTPFVPSSVYSTEDRIMASAARCARVSYRNHDGSECELGNDHKLAERLIEGNHWSPFEHQARPCELPTEGNLHGWQQARHLLEKGNTVAGIPAN